MVECRGEVGNHSSVAPRVGWGFRRAGMGGISLVAQTQLCHRVGADWAGQPLWARDLVVEPARQVRWPRQASGGLQQGRSGGGVG
jgi:hypothetical protein